MGRLDMAPVIYHFSHQHPLKLLNIQAQNSNSVICSGCKLEAWGSIYGCSACNYYLHKPCSRMPRELNHLIDPHHTLALLPLPAYPERAFNCNACGKLGTGFCYHCKECQLDIHTLCAFMPPSVNHNTHHHTLNLSLNAPYQNNGFRCDICQVCSSNCWLYRCNSCDFDAHMNCVMANTRSQPTTSTQQREQPNLVRSLSVPQQFQKPANDYLNWSQTNHHSSPPVTQQQYPMRTQGIQTQFLVPGNGFSNRPQSFNQIYPGAVPLLVLPQYVNPSNTNRPRPNLLGCVVGGIVDGLAQQAGEALLESIFEDS